MSNGSQPTLPLPSNRSLILMPADQLLNEFGAGGHSPGSGSAAALMGLLSANLNCTVYKVALRLQQGDLSQFEYLKDRIETIISPRLKELFQKDAEDFDLVIRIRRERDAETDPKIQRRYREQALRLLESSTDLVFEIVGLCLQLIDYSMIAFNKGPGRVRGDSGAAVSVAISGAMSGLFIINLNLKSFRGGRWASERRAMAADLQEKVLSKQQDAFGLMGRLTPDVKNGPQTEMF